MTSVLDAAPLPAVWIIVKISLLLAGVGLAHALLGRRLSAAARHLLLTLAIVGLLILPALSAVVPGWDAVRLPAHRDVAPIAMSIIERSNASTNAGTISAADRVSIDAVTPPRTSRAPRLEWSMLLLAVYAVGVLFLTIRLAAERWTMRTLARRASDVGDPDWTRLQIECARRMDVGRAVRFLRSREHTMPMAFGIRRPAILIPAIADEWTEERKGAVLLHELAHVARHDCLTQLLASAACVLYWFHPGVWWMARRLRVERELACDDRVLAAGTHARDYAGHLLELAYAIGDRRAPAFAVGMARPRQLEGRLRAILDGARKRALPGRRAILGSLVVAAALMLSIASAHVTTGPATAASEAAQDTPHGTWEAHPGRTPGTVQVRVREGGSSFSSTIPIERLQGLTSVDISGPGGPIHFSVQRDAGTFTFEGVVRNGVGAGAFAFAPSATFPDELAKRGIGRPTATEQYALARSDIGFAFVDELSSQRYAPVDVALLVRAAQNGVGLEYLKAMGQLGYRLQRLIALITQRQNGVDPEYIRGLAAQGLTGLSADDLVRARNNGVDPEYVKGLVTLGYRKLALDELIRLRNHGVDPEYVHGLAALGYRDLPLDELVRLRNNGVDPDYVSRLAAVGYRGFTRDDLVRLRNHGVDPEYILGMQQLGYEHLTIEELVKLRGSGVTADRVRSANARAGTRLSVDRLTSLAANGWK